MTAENTSKNKILENKKTESEKLKNSTITKKIIDFLVILIIE